MRSIDRPRRRAAPRIVSGVDLQGAYCEVVLSGWTLILAVKDHCISCDLVAVTPPEKFFDGDVVVVTRLDLTVKWHRSAHRVIVAPQYLDQLELRWPPQYALISPEIEVVTEGAIFSPEQVADEVAPYRV